MLRKILVCSLLALSLVAGAYVPGGAAVPPLSPLPSPKVERKPEAPPSREAFREVVVTLLKDPAFLDKNNAFEKGTRMHRLFESFMREILSDTAVIDFLYTSVQDNADHVTDFEAFGKALAGEYAVRGLTRLSEEDFQELLRVMGVLAERLPARDCAGMLRPGNKFDYHWLELLPEKDAESYLRLSKKALVAEIAKTPRIPANTREQTQVASQALIAELRRSLPADKLRQFGKIWEKPELADDTELCWGFQTLISSILDLPGDPRRWMVREYANMLRPAK